METIVKSADQESESFVAIVASDRLEKAREFESLNGSFLTKAICEALGVSFDDADKDKDGAIDLSDLKLWVTENARKYNQKHPDHRIPVPFVFGRERGRLFFTREPTEWNILEIKSASDCNFVLLPLLSSPYSAWMLGKTPVTNAQYKRFVDDIGYPMPMGKHFVTKDNHRAWEGPFHPWESPEFSDPDKPVVCVDLQDTIAFARWANYRDDKFSNLQVVPLEVWDFAAFGTPFPSYDRRLWKDLVIHDKSSSPAVVTGVHNRLNQYGAVDLFGNVWEWTSEEDRFDDRLPALGFIGDHPTRSNSSQQLRGGSFLDDLNKVSPMITVAALKDGQNTKHSDLGFRLACEISLHDLPIDLATRLRNATTLNVSVTNTSPAITTGFKSGVERLFNELKDKIRGS